MHRIWQEHSKYPHEIYALDKGRRAFIYASETLAMEADEQARKQADRQRNK